MRSTASSSPSNCAKSRVDRTRCCSNRWAATRRRRRAVAALRWPSIEPDALMLLLPSDHAIGDVDAFLAAVAGRRAAASAGGRLVTFGIAPDRAGNRLRLYSQGPALGRARRRLRRRRLRREAGPSTRRSAISWLGRPFLEQRHLPVPGVALSRRNWSALRPEMVAACREALAEARRDHDFIRLDKEAFAPVPQIRSITP